MTDDAWRKLAADFAAELSALRLERRVSWDDLAARSGVSRTYLRDLSAARGRGLPSPIVVERIAVALEVRPDYFRLTRARAVIASPKVIDTVYAKLPAGKAAAT